MLRHFINTIDYEKLIKMQAQECKTSISKESKNFKTSSKKGKTYGLRPKRAAHNN